MQPTRCTQLLCRGAGHALEHITGINRRTKAGKLTVLLKVSDSRKSLQKYK